MDSDFEKKFITTKEASKLTGYSSDYIGQMSRKGFYESTKVGRKLYVNRAGLLAYKAKNRPSGVDELQQKAFVSESENPAPKTLEDTYEPVFNNATFSRKAPYSQEVFEETITPTSNVEITEEEKTPLLKYPNVLAGAFAAIFLLVGVSSVSFALKDVSLKEIGIDIFLVGNRNTERLFAFPSINLKSFFNLFFVAR